MCNELSFGVLVKVSLDVRICVGMVIVIFCMWLDWLLFFMMYCVSLLGVMVDMCFLVFYFLICSVLLCLMWVMMVVIGIVFVGNSLYFSSVLINDDFLLLMWLRMVILILL